MKLTMLPSWPFDLGQALTDWRGKAWRIVERRGELVI
jgi:hypothetical protein